MLLTLRAVLSAGRQRFSRRSCPAKNIEEAARSCKHPGGHRVSRSAETLRQHPFGDQGFSGDIGHAGDTWALYNISMPQLAKFISDVVLRAPILHDNREKAS
jgi:hypothetical protein